MAGQARRRAQGMGHGAWGMEHGAWSMEKDSWQIAAGSGQQSTTTDTEGS